MTSGQMLWYLMFCNFLVSNLDRRSVLAERKEITKKLWLIDAAIFHFDILVCI